MDIIRGISVTIGTNWYLFNWAEELRALASNFGQICHRVYLIFVDILAQRYYIPFIGHDFFYVQTIREIKIENRKLGGKKKVSSVFTQYVCLCVCLCVCLFVCHRSTDFIV